MSNPVNLNPCKWTQAGTFMVLCALGSATAQSFSHSDSGWVKLWNGKDWSEGNIYSRVYGASAQPTYPPTSNWQILNPGSDTAAIYVSSTSQNQGNIGTKKTSYSHYRVRVEEKFDAAGATNNGGITYHTDETKIRMQNNWPRSIEFQMQQQYAGAAYSIQQVTFDIKASGNTYSPNGAATTGCETGCPNRYYKPSPLIQNAVGGKTRWLRFELVARGSDSAIHIINDTVVLKLSNIRIYNDKQNNTPDSPYDHGGICLQSEGALIKYRRWEIMEFPAATPKGENYLHRFLLDAPAKAPAGTTIAGGSTYTIKWRTLGPIPTVNIEYGSGTSGAWQSVAANVNNSGTYDWSVPASVSGVVRVRISGPAWAGADSSNGGGPTGIRNNPTDRPFVSPIAFSIEGQGRIATHIEGYSKVEIRDVFGREVRSLRVQGQDLFWDRKDARGNSVQPGIYFVRLLGNGAEETLRSTLF
jgi:Domain of Unknown Function (DUF1080)